MAEIAVQVAIQVLIKTSSIISDLVAEEGSRFSRLREEISWIEREMRHIRSYLKDIENKQGENERVANLMTDIRDLAFDVEDTMEKYIHIPLKKKGFIGFFERLSRFISDGYSAHNFLMKIKEIKRRVEDINRVRQTYGITERNDQVSVVERERWEERRSFPHVDEQNVTGFDDHIKKLIAEVQDEDPKLKVISIIGMAGLGKTTLAKKIYNSLRHNFSIAAWVYVSEQPIVKNILQDIARQVGLKVDKWEDNGEAILFEHLSQHRYLIVIDDIWDTGTWNKIKNAIPLFSKNSSRIILTSRIRDVGVHVGGRDSLFELNILEEGFSKQLFETSIGHTKNENDLQEVEKIGEVILNKCGGVPLAIVVVAGLLKLKERSENAWNGVLEQMDQAQGDYSKIFDLSYIDLPSYLKPCFLYLGIFPEDHKIDTFDLINLWAAEGFIKASRIREIEDVGEDYLNILIARNLIQVVSRRSNGKVKNCRIHDILRDLCIEKAKEINFFYSSADLNNYKGERVRRVTTHGTGLRDYISANYRTPKLRSFLCFNGVADADLLMNFPKDLNYLRVAHFHACVFDFSPWSTIIWSFKNLTYLKLQNDGEPWIPENIIILESLVTLDLRGFGRIFDFPMVIWNMKRLRHLLLPKPKTFRKDESKGFDSKAISFRNFQTLAVSSRILYNAWLHEFSNLRTLKITESDQEIADLLLTSSPALNKLENLRLERVSWKGISVSTLNLLNYEKLSKLHLKSVVIGNWPNPDKFPPNLTKLVLVQTGIKGDPLEIMKKIPKLRVLELVEVFFDGKKMVCNGEPGNFSQLEELVIISVDDVEIIIEEGGMPRLGKLCVRACFKPKVPSRIEKIMNFRGI